MYADKTNPKTEHFLQRLTNGYIYKYKKRHIDSEGKNEY